MKEGFVDGEGRGRWMRSVELLLGCVCVRQEACEWDGRQMRNVLEGNKCKKMDFKKRTLY